VGLSAWDVVPSPNGGTANNTLEAVSALSATDAWAVGRSEFSDPEPIVEHFDGTAWRTVTAPAVTGSPTMTGMVARSASDVWAVGYAAAGSFPVDHTVTLHFDGVCWSTVDSPNVGTGDNLLRGVAAGPVDLWAVGQSLTPAYTTLILHHS